MNNETFEEGQKLAYTELGKFLAVFEHTTHYFKECIAEILKLNGLSDDNYSDILLSKLTADPIKSIFQSMAPYYFEESESKTVNKLITEYGYLIQIRNIIIHCYWAIGVSPGDPVDLSLVGIKNKTSKKGIEYLDLDLDLTEIRNINELLEDFCDEVNSLSNLIRMGAKSISELELKSLEKPLFKPVIEKLNRVH